jgi:hypothetical protein
MPNITIFSTEYITVEYYPDRKLIYHTIHKPIAGQVQMFKDALDVGTATMTKYQLCKWLSDDRKNGPLPAEMLDWSSNDWSQRTIDAGWKYWANVVPEEIDAAGTLIPVIDHLYNLGLRMAVFRTPQVALEWLDKME